MRLETLGVPTVVVTTSSFRRLSEQVAASLGRADLRIAVTRHPIGGVDPATAERWADEVVDDVHELLTSTRPGAAARSGRSAAGPAAP